MPWSSNATYLCEVDVRRRRRRARSTSPGAASGRCGTSRRASTTARWPPTSCPRRSAGTSSRSRSSATGRSGSGSVQRFVDADFEQHYFTLYEDEANHDQLRAICAFDLVGNNTDRKSGHCLLGLDGRIQRHRPRPDVPPRVQAADGDLGVRRRARPRAAPRGRRRAGQRGAARTRWPRCSTRSSATPCAPGPGRWCERAASRSTRPAAATPGRSSEPS